MEGVKELHGNEIKYNKQEQIGMAHRDLKPKNIIIGRENNLKIIDFGVSTPIMNEIDGSELMAQGRYGTRRYMAPEV